MTWNVGSPAKVRSCARLASAAALAGFVVSQARRQKTVDVTIIFKITLNFIYSLKINISIKIPVSRVVY